MIASSGYAIALSSSLELLAFLRAFERYVDLELDDLELRRTAAAVARRAVADGFSTSTVLEAMQLVGHSRNHSVFAPPLPGRSERYARAIGVLGRSYFDECALQRSRERDVHGPSAESRSG